MTSTQNAAGEDSTPVAAKDFLGRELNVGDKVVYATANLEGTADLNVAWVVNLRTVTLFSGNRESAVADLTYESGTSTCKDTHCRASELVLVESAK